MTIETLKSFFMWAAILNAAVVLIYGILFASARDFLYNAYSWFVPVSRETFHVVALSLLGFMEVVFWMLFFVPYMALVVIA